MSSLNQHIGSSLPRRAPTTRTFALPRDEPLWTMLTSLLFVPVAAALIWLRTWAWLPATALP